MIFEERYFKELEFSSKQIKRYLDSAYKDLNIAKDSQVSEVKFQFSYNALIKLGITLTACHNKKVSSRAGHHIKLIEVIASELKDTTVSVIANQMRKTRNIEMYDGGESMVSNKQAQEYLKFVDSLFEKSEILFKKRLNRLL